MFKYCNRTKVHNADGVLIQMYKLCSTWDPPQLTCSLTIRANWSQWTYHIIKEIREDFIWKFSFLRGRWRGYLMNSMWSKQRMVSWDKWLAERFVSMGARFGMKLVASLHSSITIRYCLAVTFSYIGYKKKITIQPFWKSHYPHRNF